MAKKPKKVIQEATENGDYLLANRDKLNRVIFGVTDSHGNLIGGIGEKAPQEEILAHYDRLGGLITTRDGQKVEMGSFWDFEAKKARKEPLVSFVRRGQPQIVTVEVGDEEPKKRVKRVR